MVPDLRCLEVLRLHQLVDLQESLLSASSGAASLEACSVFQEEVAGCAVSSAANGSGRGLRMADGL